MKEFQALRTELNDGIEDLTEHVNVPSYSMPPQILILRRKTVRQFPDGVMVALYQNDRLGLQFSIPYGGRPESVVTPVALKEARKTKRGPNYGNYSDGKWVPASPKEKVVTPVALKEEELAEVSSALATKAYEKRKTLGQVAKMTHGAQRRYTDRIAKDHKAKAPRDYDDHYIEEGFPVLKAKTKDQKRAIWMADFEQHVVKTNPAHSGKISWDDAHFHHSQGTDPQVAAKKYTDSHPTPFESHFHREEAEQLDELKKSTLKSYINKAASDVGTRSREEQYLASLARATRGKGYQRREAGYLEAQNKEKKKVDKHLVGIQRATEKLEEAEQLHEATHSDPVATLRNIVHGHAMSHVKHDDGTRTHVDPTTANMLLTVHDHPNLSPENRVKFATALKKSKPMFHKIVDFGWKQVK